MTEEILTKDLLITLGKPDYIGRMVAAVIDVVVSQDAPRIQKEQARKMLALGFIEGFKTATWVAQAANEDHAVKLLSKLRAEIKLAEIELKTKPA